MVPGRVFWGATMRWTIFLAAIGAGLVATSGLFGGANTALPEAADEARTAAEPNDPNYPNDPGQLVQVKWDVVMSILKNEDLDEQAKADRIARAVTPAFDFALMGKLALGRTHWPTLSEAQQTEYIRLFTERLKTRYRQMISLYKDETITFKQAVKQPNGTVDVPTELLTGDRKYAIVYKLRNVEKKWMVYDVEIQGVSILLTYRSQFDDILRRGTVQELLARLAEPTEKK